MQQKIILQGDWHTSTRDPDRLLSRLSEDTDAVLIEGRSPQIDLYNFRFWYLFYLIGYLQLMAFYSSIEWIKTLVPGTSPPNPEEQAEGLGLCTHSDIDANTRQIWDITTQRSQCIGFVFVILLIIYGVGAAVLGLGSGSILQNAIGVTTIISAPFIFTGVQVYSLKSNSKRDEIMAESVIDICSTQDYSEVGLLVGDFHVSGVAQRLEDEGFKVEKERSGTLLAKLIRSVS